MLMPTDAVDLRFVASLSRPGGNITRLTTQTARDLAAKRVQFLKEVTPNLRRIAVLWDPTDPSRQLTVDETARAARKLRLDVEIVGASGAGELDAAFAKLTRAGSRGVVVIISTMLFTNHARIAHLALRQRLPTICATPEEVEPGNLMSFAPDYLASTAVVPISWTESSVAPNPPTFPWSSLRSLTS
jgi:putative ABC transport system substrate-binding protein